MRGRRKRGGKRVRNVNRRGDRVLVSGSMLMEVETILQTQEPVIRPAWHTFASSVSGIWKGVGAVYSPITAEMEPIDIGSRDENLFDCYTLSHIKALPSTSEALNSQIQRKVNWVTLNPYGETQNNKASAGPNLPSIESFDFGRSDVMEEDVMGMEAGLVYFEDGSYSRGPVDIPIGEYDESNYYLSPTFKFEQCLVKGCHKRLRVVHTIEFSNGGSDIQIMRVAAYEEEWVSPANIPDTSELELDLKPFSQRKRVQPSELAGSWKVFEMSATPIYGEDMTLEEGKSAPYVYLCNENLKKRSLPENLVYFGEEEMLDMQDVTVLWLPGGVTAYVDVNKEGILCVGVGWYSDEGINLVMEREYGLDGKLKEVRWKSEMKRRWTNPPPM
ncbi:dihydroorotate dehydrogenase [Perilla frutescens var. hirtella]|nr:dihydroorotate dehydrogenase [Perilla frutescens var. frutescens]KAH6793848.1 dihydroorotate dehydrogenase [Perilla frutescens var. hirtella]